MGEHTVQFTVDDVVNRFQEFRKLEERQRDAVLERVKHDLLSDFSSVILYARMFVDEKQRYGSMPSLPQQAYADCVKALSSLVKEHFYMLARSLQGFIQSPNLDDVMTIAAERLVDTLQILTKYTSLTEHILCLGSLPEKRLECSQRIDVSCTLALYTFNLFFAKNFQRTAFNLEQDLKTFGITYRVQLHTISLQLGRLVTIETPQDYFANTVLPLFKNAQQHAYNPDNDVNGRRNKTFDRYVTISSEPVADKPEVCVKVVDNGFGIRPEIMERLFQKGVSTKTDTEMEHGIGLWAVKEFVEQQGGRIWVETELGKGTTFRFTVPYKEKIGFRYKA